MSERTRIRIGRLLIVAGTLFLTYWFAVRADAWVFQSRMTRRLDAAASLRAASGDRAHESRGADADMAGLIGRIEIPRLRLSALVLEGTAERTLRRGVGHVERTALPGESGNVGLAAHRDTYFGKLAGVSNGDLILIRTSEGSFTYQVESTLVVLPDRGDLLEEGGPATLTLVTCYPFHWIGPAPQRFVVRARRVESPSPQS
jgi:sortase A